MFKQLYPSTMGCNPIHEVRDWLKVRNLIRAALRGDAIPPIIIDAQDGNMLTGTHRAAANYLMRKLGREDHLIDTVTVDMMDVSEELQEAIDNLDYETIDYLVDQSKRSS